MIGRAQGVGRAGTVGLHATSTQRERERQQWGGREGASTAMFDQWLNAVTSLLPFI